MKLNLDKGWKRHKQDKDFTHLRNDQGHELRVSHRSLSPKMRGMLAQLPQAEMPHLADGGEPESKKKTLGEMIGYPGSGPIKKAEGGEVSNPQSGMEAIKKENYEKPKKKKHDDELPESASEDPNAGFGRSMADGGGVSPSPKPKDDVRDPDPEKAKKFVKDFEKPTSISEGIANARKELGFAHGGSALEDDREAQERILADKDKIGYERDEDPYRGVPNNELKEREEFDEWRRMKRDKAAKMASGGEVEDKKEEPKLDESMAKHIGRAINEGVKTAIGDVVGGVKYAAAPVMEFGKGLMGSQEEAPPASPEASGLGQSPTQPPTAGAPGQPQGLAAANAPKQPPQDLYGTEAYSNAFEQGVKAQKEGINAEEAAQSKLGELQQKVYAKQAEAQQNMIDSYAVHTDQLNKERQDFVQDIHNKHIDPNQYVGSLDTGQKMATIAGLILGGIGGGGQGNAALDFLNKQIDRDIEAQKSNIGKSESLLNANLKQFGNLRDATDMTRVMMSDVASRQIQDAAAKTMDPMAKARAQQALGVLDQQVAPVMSQIAMRKSLIGGAQSGRIDPAQVIRMIVPKEEKHEALKQLQEAQELHKTKEDVKNAIQKIYDLNKLSSRASSPIQSRKQIAAIKNPLLAHISTVLANRFTEQDAKMLEDLLDQGISGDEASMGVAKEQADKLFGQKMNFPMLDQYGIPSSVSGAQANPIKKYPIQGK